LAKRSLLANVKGLRELKARCAALHERVHSVNLPDGRRAWTRSDYAALNTLLQASGAIVMKLAVVLLHRHLREKCIEFKQVSQAHDEIQGECRPEDATTVQLFGCEAIGQAGIALGIRCPLKGEAKSGKNWAETH
jgi:DNA polymerase-1